MALIFIIYGLIALEDEHIKNFLIKANQEGEIKYEFVSPHNCSSGFRENTYVLAPTGKVVMKQISPDGTLGNVCE